VRRIVSIGLLLAYLGTVLTAFAPLVYYISNQAYISQNLCENKDQVRLECHGKCFLAEQLSETTKKSNQENRIELEKYPELNNIPVCVTALECSQILPDYPKLHHLYFSDYQKDVFHPPTNRFLFFDDFC